MSNVSDFDPPIDRANLTPEDVSRIKLRRAVDKAAKKMEALADSIPQTPPISESIENPTPTPMKSFWKATGEVIGKGVLAITGLCVLGGIVVWSNQHIPHHHDTPVWINGNWMVGEYRRCELMHANTVRPPFLNCSVGLGDGGSISSHDLSVSYIGDIDFDTADDKVLPLRCQRLSDSLECRTPN